MKTETGHDTIRSTAEIAACMTIIFSYLAFLTVEHEQLSRNLVNAAIGSAAEEAKKNERNFSKSF
jgi:hypothetical protein